MLPSLASMRDENLPPTRKSFSAFGVCQSCDGLFHFTICPGSVQSFHAFSTGALIVASTVIFVFFAVVIAFVFNINRISFTVLSIVYLLDLYKFTMTI